MKKHSIFGLMAAVALVVAAGVGGTVVQGGGANPADMPSTAQQQKVKPLPSPSLLDCAIC
jgi:hypothetical protein